MYEMLQKMKDVSAPVIHIHLARIYIEKNAGKIEHCNWKTYFLWTIIIIF